MDNNIKSKSEIYSRCKINLSPDPNTNELISRILDRDKEGMDKFKLTMRQAMFKNPKDTLHWLHNTLEESIDLSRYLIEAIYSFQIVFEENKKLKKELKEEKEYEKMMYHSP